MTTYIYTLSNPLTNEIKYVGKTINLRTRYAGHLSNGKLNRCSKVSNWIKNLLNNNLKPVMEIIDSTDNDWASLEVYWISQLKTWGFDLKNITEGGEGTLGYYCLDSTKNKIRKTRLDKLQSGDIIPTKHTDVWKNHLKLKYAFNDEKIKELFLNNKSANEIATLLNTTTKTVYERLKKYNLFYTTKKFVDINAINKFINEGLNYIEIAKIFGVSTSKISREYRNSVFYKKLS